MDRNKLFFHWILLHLSLFCVTPFVFMLTGLLVGVIIIISTPGYGNDTRTGSLLVPPYLRSLYLLAPLLSGGFLGTATGILQTLTMRKLAPHLKASQWISASIFGSALAFLAIAWAYNDSSLSNPLPLASVFGGAVYGLVSGVPQSRMLKKHIEKTWMWILAASFAGSFPFILACSSMWLAEGKVYLWLIFPLCAGAGILYGLVTGILVFLLPHFRQFSALVPGGVQEKSIQ